MAAFWWHCSIRKDPESGWIDGDKARTGSAYKAFGLNHGILYALGICCGLGERHLTRTTQRLGRASQGTQRSGCFPWQEGRGRLEPTAAWLQAGPTQAPSSALAPCPHLPIKIKKLISFCLPDRTRLFLWDSKCDLTLSMARVLIVFVVLSLIVLWVSVLSLAGSESSPGGLFDFSSCKRLGFLKTFFIYLFFFSEQLKFWVSFLSVFYK